uniref:Nuclear receptor 2C2-associated protein-like n=1 Tax=Sinocyclocheilus grahami TaxID=75366 RepID=A0A672P1E6_SINGR
MAESLICDNTQSRVSSVLNRDVKQFGKKFMFDSNEETCWNSDQGESQWVVLEFPQPVKVFELRIQFQGGFSGKSCKLEGSAKEEDLKRIVDFYPEDNNCLQISFHVVQCYSSAIATFCHFRINLDKCRYINHHIFSD